MQARTLLGKLIGSVIATGIAAGLAPSIVSASDVLRCGNDLVMQGDPREKVRSRCGEPADIGHSNIMRRPSYVRNGRVIYFGEEMIEVRVETWTYDFGPNKLMRKLRFVDGILEDIDTLGYGHNPPRSND